MNSETPIPGNRWVCVEWVLDGGKPDVTRIYSDGVLVKYTQSASTPGPEKVQRWGKLVLGFIPYHGSDATDLWLDELAIAPSRIGCDR